MKRSAALTLAHQNKQRRANWAFDTFGKDLTVTNKKGDKKVSFEMPRSSKKIKFADGNLNYMLVVPKSSPLPIILTARPSLRKLSGFTPSDFDR